MRRRSRNPAPYLAVLIPMALVLGIWLGGHPDHPPRPRARHAGGRQRRPPLRGGVDTIERDYYRKVDRKDAAEQVADAAVDSLQDQFSHYFSPSDYTGFQETPTAQFEGVGMTVTRGQGAACASRRSTTARRPSTAG